MFLQFTFLYIIGLAIWVSLPYTNKDWLIDWLTEYANINGCKLNVIPTAASSLWCSVQWVLQKQRCLWRIVRPKGGIILTLETVLVNSKHKPGYGSLPYRRSSIRKTPNDQTSERGRSKCSVIASGASHFHASCSSIIIIVVYYTKRQEVKCVYLIIYYYFGYSSYFTHKHTQIQESPANATVSAQQRRYLVPPGESEYNTQHRLLTKFRENSNVQQFKVIQGRWFWYQSKALMRVPISH